MATRPKIPKFDAPVLDAGGRMNLEWYRFFSSLPQAGDYATTVGAAGGAAALPATPKGYYTITINGTQFSVPFYNP